MDSKKILATGLLASSLLTACNTYEKKIDDTKDKIIDTLETLQDQHRTRNTIDTLSQERKDTAHFTEGLASTLSEQTEMLNIKELYKTNDPLVTRLGKRNTSLRIFLGEQDVNDIIRLYNPHLIKKHSDTKDWSGVSIRNIDTLIIPRVFPSVKDFFKTNLQDFLADKPAIADSLGGEQTAVIVTMLPNKTMGLAYYENGVLNIAGPTSPGNGSRYPSQDPATRYLSDKDINGKSTGKVIRKYHARSPQLKGRIQSKDPAHISRHQRDPMAYYNEIDPRRGLGFHGSWQVNGKGLSHGCFRFVHILSKFLDQKTNRTDATNAGTLFVSHWEPTKKEYDSIYYFTKMRPELTKARLEKNKGDSLNTDKYSYYKEIEKWYNAEVKRKTGKALNAKESKE